MRGGPWHAGIELLCQPAFARARYVTMQLRLPGNWSRGWRSHRVIAQQRLTSSPKPGDVAPEGISFGIILPRTRKSDLRTEFYPVDGEGVFGIRNQGRVEFDTGGHPFVSDTYVDMTGIGAQPQAATEQLISISNGLNQATVSDTLLRTQISRRLVHDRKLAFLPIRSTRSAPDGHPIAGAELHFDCRIRFTESRDLRLTSNSSRHCYSGYRNRPSHFLRWRHNSGGRRGLGRVRQLDDEPSADGTALVASLLLRRPVERPEHFGRGGGERNSQRIGGFQNASQHPDRRTGNSIRAGGGRRLQWRRQAGLRRRVGHDSLCLPESRERHICGAAEISHRIRERDDGRRTFRPSFERSDDPPIASTKFILGPPAFWTTFRRSWRGPPPRCYRSRTR